jgi:hypothetical protein
MTALAELGCRMTAALAGEVPLFIYRGDTKAWRFRLWADEDRTEPYDLAQVDVSAQIRRTPDDRRRVDLACSVELPNIIVAYLSAEASATCPTGRWDCQLTWPDGRVLTAIKGPVTVTPDVTRHD